MQVLEEHEDLGNEQEQPTDVLNPEDIAQAPVEDYVKHKRVRPARPAADRPENKIGEMLTHCEARSAGQADNLLSHCYRDEADEFSEWISVSHREGVAIILDGTECKH